MMSERIIIFWFRRDLRLNDNHGLYQALKQKIPVLPIFIFDDHFFSQFGSTDKRFSLIYDQLSLLNNQLVEHKSTLRVFRGKPIEVFDKIIQQLNIDAVYANEDYEPYSIQRDRMIEKFLESKGIKWQCFPDHVIFRPQEILKDDQKPYTVFTPYKNKWLHSLSSEKYLGFPSENYFCNFYKQPYINFPTPHDLGIQYQNYQIRSPQLENIVDYEKYRDFPAMNKTTNVSVHLRFGMISKRHLVKKAIENNNPVYLNELIWHDFFNQIMFHFPKVEKENFNSRFNRLEWLNKESDFELWCQARTGYPLVDAGIKELLETGYMHNRVRMVVASFLCKHLLIDWRWGELFFAQHLMDYDLALNNGNWQWCAGTGCDAAPFFRIFNPISQQQRFDPMGDYTRSWLDKNYSIKPIVEHHFARERALSWYRGI
ncbi:MAG: DNA photolyase family protein [Bacteroidales bacterium]|nr:DNA photolyase family protein [Bacteroidales bacterium]